MYNKAIINMEIKEEEKEIISKEEAEKVSKSITQFLETF